MLAVGGALYATDSNANDVTSVEQVYAKSGRTRLVASINGGLLDNPILYSGLLVATANESAALPDGGVVSIDLKTGTVKTSYAFKGGNDASDPEASPLAVSGVLYGQAIPAAYTAMAQSIR